MYVSVVFPVPVDQVFTYLVPETLADRVKIGSRVNAPFGLKKLVGFVVGLDEKPPESDFRLKEILQVLDSEPVFSEDYVSFVMDISREFHSSAGEILQAALPPVFVTRKRKIVVLNKRGFDSTAGEKLSSIEKKIVSLLLGKKQGLAPGTIQRKLGLSSFSRPLKKLEEQNIIRIKEKTISFCRHEILGEIGEKIQLSLDFSLPEATDVLAALEKRLDQRIFGQYYLYGSRSKIIQTYLRLIKKTVRSGGRVLVLFPQIEPMLEFAGEMKTALGIEPAVLHGQMSSRQKDLAWQAILSGKTMVVAGTRGTVFAPVDRVKLIILDSEHDEAFLQEENPIYDARRAARRRAQVEKAVIVFASSTPTVEAFYEASQQNLLIRLGEDDVRKNVDWVFKKENEPGIISGEIISQTRLALESGKKAVFFLNRRGYASASACFSCGHVPECPRCRIPLVLHKENKIRLKLTCHYCNHLAKFDAPCPRCGGSLARKKQPGIEAVEEELRAIFPDPRIARLDSETASSPGNRRKIIQDFSRGKSKILVGTQLLSSCGRLPEVELVVILYPERLLDRPDFKASQQAFSVISAVASLADFSPRSKIIVQTSPPVHFSVRSAVEGNYESFFASEIEYRRLMNYPPFSVLAELSIFGRNPRSLAARSRQIVALFKGKAGSSTEVFGPVLISPPGKKGQLSVQFVLKSQKKEELRGLLGELLSRVQLKKKVRYSYSSI